jgi:hypothetical protein
VLIKNWPLHSSGAAAATYMPYMIPGRRCSDRESCLSQRAILPCRSRFEKQKSFLWSRISEMIAKRIVRVMQQVWKSSNDLSWTRLQCGLVWFTWPNKSRIHMRDYFCKYANTAQWKFFTFSFIFTKNNAKQINQRNWKNQSYNILSKDYKSQ